MNKKILKLFLIRTVAYLFGFLLGSILYGLLFEDNWLFFITNPKYYMFMGAIIIIFTVYDYFKFYKKMK